MSRDGRHVNDDAAAASICRRRRLLQQWLLLVTHVQAIAVLSAVRSDGVVDRGDHQRHRYAAHDHGGQHVALNDVAAQVAVTAGRRAGAARWQVEQQIGSFVRQPGVVDQHSDVQVGQAAANRVVGAVQWDGAAGRREVRNDDPSPNGTRVPFVCDARKR